MEELKSDIKFIYDRMKGIYSKASSNFETLKSFYNTCKKIVQTINSTKCAKYQLRFKMSSDWHDNNTKVSLVGMVGILKQLADSDKQIQAGWTALKSKYPDGAVKPSFYAGELQKILAQCGIKSTGESNYTETVSRVYVNIIDCHAEIK